jgi:hypothetical protein
VVIDIHGGAWSRGDRSELQALGSDPSPSKMSTNAIERSSPMCELNAAGAELGESHVSAMDLGA